MEVTATFVYERDTKNKYRFQEEADEPVIGALYVTKGTFKDRPKKVKVVLKVLE